MTLVLVVALLVEAAVVVVFLLAQLVDAVLTRRATRARHDAERARSLLVQAVVRNVCDDELIATLRRLQPRAQDRALCAVAAQVRSRNDPIFVRLAETLGTDARIARDLESGRWWVRRAALRRATVLGAPVSGVVGLLQDRDPRVREATVTWIETVRSVEAPGSLLVPLLLDVDDRVRHGARTAIVRLGSAAQEDLLRAIRQGAPDLRSAALDVAVALGDPVVAAAVRPLLDHPAELTPSAVLASVPALRPDDARAVARLFDHRDGRVRCAAIEAAGRAALMPTVAGVARHLDADEGATREAAIDALERLGPTGEVLLRRAARARAGDRG